MYCLATAVNGCAMMSCVYTTITALYVCGTKKLGDVELKEHDVITIDGSTGEVYLGTVERRSATEDEDFQTVLGWADKMRKLKVRDN